MVNNFAALLFVYLMVFYLARVDSVSEVRDLFIPSFMSATLFILGLVSESVLMCIPFIIECINVLDYCIQNPSEWVETIGFSILFVLIGFVTFGIFSFIEGGSGEIGSEVEGDSINENSYSSDHLASSASDKSSAQAESEGTRVSGAVNKESVRRGWLIDHYREGLDLDGDGEIEGLDLNGDGEIDHNIIGVEVPDTEVVEGYMREDGTYIASYIRSESDFSSLNNLDPT